MENLTEAKIENKKTFLLSLMTKAVAHQKSELESSEWDVDYMIEEEGSIKEFFEQIVLGEDDVCEQVLAEFIEVHELEDVDLTETSFIDETRNIQHELIEHMTKLYS